MGKILLVEDDNNLREIYEARLQAEGYTIVTAKDGEEALVVAKSEKPDLVISDVMMPKISGFEMLDILRNTEGLRDVKVIMLTALGQSDDQQRANRLGADHYLVKSQVTLEDIVKVTHELLQDDPGAEAASPPSVIAESLIVPGAAPALQPEPTPAASPAPMPAPAPDISPSPATAAPSSLDDTSAPAVVAPSAVTPPMDPIAPPLTVAMPPAPAEPAQAPAPAPAPALDSNSLPQTTAQEEASMEARIEDFVEGASSTAPAPTPTEPPVSMETSAPEMSAPTPEAALTSVENLDTTPTAPTPEPDPAAPPSDAPSVEAAATDDKVIADAVNNLIADTTTAPAPASTPTAPPVTNAPETEPTATPPTANGGSVPIAHKKIVIPTSSQPKQDLNTLLALEASKDDIPAPTPEAPSEESPAAPGPEVTAPAADVTPAPPAPSPDANNPLDPNSIAL